MSDLIHSEKVTLVREVQRGDFWNIAQGKRATKFDWDSLPGRRIRRLFPGWKLSLFCLNQVKWRAHLTHFISSARQVDQVEGYAEICSGVAACLAKTTDHDSEKDQHQSLTAIRTVEPHDSGYRRQQEQS
jgi:hypothetical protein